LQRKQEAARRRPAGPDHQKETAMRLKGFAAIEFAEKRGLTLSKFPGHENQARTGLTVAEAEAIATEDEDLIYLDVPDELARDTEPGDFVPQR
jgi:hypothetical protein